MQMHDRLALALAREHQQREIDERASERRHASLGRPSAGPSAAA